MIPFIGNIDITYDQMQSINCYKYVEYVRLIVFLKIYGNRHNINVRYKS